jgi:hypothetical protein
LCCRFPIEDDQLPRQARDKNEDRLKKKAFSPAGPAGVVMITLETALCKVRKTLSFRKMAPFCTNNGSFYQDGLGTNTGKALTKKATRLFSEQASEKSIFEQHMIASRCSGANTNARARNSCTTSSFSEHHQHAYCVHTLRRFWTDNLTRHVMTRRIFILPSESCVANRR